MSTVATAEAPIATPAPMSLRDHIAAEEPPAAGAAHSPAAPAPAVPVVVAPAEPDAVALAEADSPKPDAELSDAGRKLRMNRADKRAERIRTENDELARQLQRRQELRSELERVAPAPPASVAASPAAGTTAPDPNDPKPLFDVEKYTKASPDDPYAGYLLDLNRWDRRQEQRTQQAEQRQRQGQQATQAMAGRLAQHVEAGRAKFSDFDTVLDSVVTALAAGGPQRDADVTEFLLASTVGGDLMYALGKDPAALQAVLHAKNRPELARALVTVEGRLTGPKTPEPPPTTQAPPPPSALASGVASAAEPDTRKGVPLKDHIRIEEAEIADRQKRGYRY